MKKLSPAAEAVMDAFWTPVHKIGEDVEFDRRQAAAALRAAACEVVPVPISAETTSEHWALLGVKNRLLAIADELEGH